MTKTLSERISECKQDIIDAGLEPEHDIGFQIIEELKEELEERKSYIVANPCGQCGGIINAIKCQAWKEEADKLKAENKIWQEMVDSVNQTNQAMGNMLNEFEAKIKGNVWMPIETAPKDGSQILIFEKRVYKLDDEEIFIARWEKGTCWASNDFRDYIGWHIGSNDEIDCWAENPTHWMPLPAVPTKIKGE